MLASCAMSDDKLATVLEPAPPADYRTCEQLVAVIKASIAHQKELQNLQTKAGTGIGAVIGTTTYRPEYLKERGNEINMRQFAREKKCTLPADLPPLERE